MKKLIMTVAVAIVAGIANAAAVSWQSGNVYVPGADGVFGEKVGDSDKANIYLFVLADADTYAKVQADGAWATYGEKLNTATATQAGTTGSKFADMVTSGYSANQTIYAAIITTYNDGAKNWYTENYVTVTIDSLGSDATVKNLSRYDGGTSAGGNLTWQSATAVPEPTSGLLILVGLAGLALRRRRA